MGNSRVAFRVICLAIVVLGGLLIGAVTGLVFYAVGAQLPVVIGAAGGGFVGVVTLSLTALKFLTD